nr:MAG TPA: receptor binding protein [Caudoviricetes sp.]
MYRLENFSKLESERLYVPNATFVKVYKIAGMVTLIVDSGTAFFNKANTPIFNLPEKYRPNETLYFSASYRNSSKSNTFFLYANGNLAKSEADDNAGAYYFTISYPAKSIN